MSEKKKEVREETVEHRYFIKRSDGTMGCFCGTRENVITEARVLATKWDEEVEILLRVGRVRPPAFEEDTYTPL